ncbi:MAG TPA: PHP domain-containing protein [Gemmatimonadales bacterium]
MTAPGPAAGHGARFVDLHSHSTASDGAMAPAAVVERAGAAGLAALALTDHDTLAGVAEAMAAGERVGVRVVAGAELSAHDGEDEVHLLALHVEDPAVLDAELARFRERRHERAAEMVRLLRALGASVTLESVLERAGEGAVGRPHVARAMVDAGFVRDHREAFDRYIGAGRPAYVPKDVLPVVDAIRIAHDAGGIAVFAHPGGSGTRDRVERFARAGLDGLEVLHPSHGSEDVARLGALADHFGMVRSGGSDWHGATEGPRTLGVMRVPHAWLDAQDERVAARRHGGG